MLNPVNSQSSTDTNPAVSNPHPIEIPTIIAKPDANAIMLNAIVADDSTPWQVHNCKIIDKMVTQDEPLPFIYHYDALPEEIKTTNPLTPDLLKHFNTPMIATEVSSLLNISPDLVNVPWQVKVTGTLVMFCERLQIALRLKFTNTAKTLDPIYTKTSEDALKIAMANWHFYGAVFVLNKSATPLIVVGAMADSDDNWATIERTDDYQALRSIYALPILQELEEVKQSLTVLDEAIQLRLS